VRERIGRVEVHDLPEHLDGFLIAVLALQARRDLVERRERVARETELLVELRDLSERWCGVLVLDRGTWRPMISRILLVDGDRLEAKIPSCA